MKDIITLVIMGVLFVTLLPIIGKIALILLGAAVIFGIFVYGRSISERDKIAKDPQKYFNEQANKNKDVIDVTFKEKVIEEEKVD